MKTILHVAWMLVLAQPASAATIVGRDCANQDIVCDGSPVCGGPDTCSNSDELQGTFTRVRLFSVGVGTTVFVFPATPLAVYASTISIAGTINGQGRGLFGGSQGQENSPGLNGSGAGPGAIGGGGGGAPGKAGGGGGHSGAGGLGPGSSGGGTPGTAYDGGAFVTSPLSADEAVMGSGGGAGGGGGTGHGPGSAGGSGGNAVYLEASSITIVGSGSIIMDGGTASPTVDLTGVGGIHPGGGGGGGGGSVVLRVPGKLQPGGTGKISAIGGNGSLVAVFVGGAMNPGAGGGGGRIRIIYQAADPFTITLSTTGGNVGSKSSGAFESTSTANAGSTGTVSFGFIASSPTVSTVSAVYLTSVTWAWNVAISTWGDAAEASRRFRVYASSSFAPLPVPQVSVGSAAANGTETGLSPNSMYTRVVTAFTDWGDSLFSSPTSTITFASPPGPPVGVSTFSNVQERQLTLNWGPGAPAQNPGYTEYEVWRSTLSDFSVFSSTRLVALSSTPVSLTPETVYFFKVRAVNLAGTLTAFTTTFAIATSTTVPTAPGMPIPTSPYSYDGTGTFTWAPASAPSGIKEYFLQVGSFPGAADVVNQAIGNVTSFALAGLASGKSYFARVRARSNAELDGDFSGSSPPLTVFVPAQEPVIAKPINWPNPFDPTQGPTTIGFAIPEPATVTLKIFSLNGQLVYQEVRQFGAPGNQIWPWDGRSGSGRRVAPGGYILVIEKRMAGSVDTQRSKIAVLY